MEMVQEIITALEEIAEGRKGNVAGLDGEAAFRMGRMHCQRSIAKGSYEDLFLADAFEQVLAGGGGNEALNLSLHKGVRLTGEVNLAWSSAT
jgi:hypothetical protein